MGDLKPLTIKKVHPIDDPYIPIPRLCIHGGPNGDFAPAFPVHDARSPNPTNAVLSAIPTDAFLHM